MMCSKQKFNPPKEEFIRIYDELYSFEKVAKHYKVSKSAVARYSKKIGYVNSKRKDISWTPPSEKEFVDKYCELKSKNRMAEYYGVCDRTILKYAKKINFRNQYRPSLSEANIEYIISNYSTKRAQDIADELGVSKSLITKVWTENGLVGKCKRTYYINENYFEKINSPDKAYFLGVIAADGCVYSYKNSTKMKTLNFIFHIQEKDIIDTFLKCTDATYKPHIKKDRIMLQINSDKLVLDLLKYNITERKTWTFIPPILNEELMWHFLRGYFDGDGSIYLCGKNIPSNWFVSICGNKQTIEFFSKFLQSQGITVKVSMDNRTEKYQYDFYYFRIRKRFDKDRFLSHLYQNSDGIRLERKYDKYLEYIKVCNNTPS